jgi:hypothetical protein
MSSDDRQSSVPSVVTVVSAETAVTPVPATGALALIDATPPLAEPKMLVQGLRELQLRIPEFTHLRVREKRSYARAANLDPEFLESGLHAADVWRETRNVVQRSAEELRQDDEQIRRWDEVVVELRAITDGIEAANLKRKHRLGSAILHIYRMLAITLRPNGRPDHDYMRPYFENMKRAYLRTQKFSKRPKKEEPAPDPAPPPSTASAAT